MKFIRDLLGKKRNEETARRAPSVESLEQSYRDTIGAMVDDAGQLDQAPMPSDVLTNEVRVVSAEA